MIRTSYDSIVVSLEEAVKFIDDSFVHLKRLLTRSNEKLEGLAVREPGIYKGDADKFEFLLWMTFFTILMFNLRLAFRGKSQTPAKIKST